METFARHTVHTLVSVEQIRGTIPCVAQHVNIEIMAELLFHNRNLAVLRRRIANLGKADSTVFEKLFQLVFMLIAHLDNYSRVLCKQRFYDVIARYIVQIDMQSARRIGESHL